MIVACHACPSQYSVPDAKVRGKKVRITCKHCGASIIVDGTDIPLATDPAPLPSRLPSFNPPPSFESLAAQGETPDDVTVIARRRFGQDLSVHEEPTVIGQIPREALAYERAFAQRTQPPPGNDELTAEAAPAPMVPEEPLPRFPSARPSALPEAPESPHDETKRASPRAFARGEPAPPLAPPAPALVSPQPPPAPPTVVIKQTRDEPTLVSRALAVPTSPPPELPQQRSIVVRIALMVLALALVSFLILKLR